MKKFAIALFASSLLFAACHKKKETTGADPLPATKPFLKVKINGNDYSCNGCFSSYHSGNIHGVNFSVGQNGDRFVINITGQPSSGLFSLVKFGNPSFNYQKNNTYFRGSGELNITAIDTSANGVINKLIATFHCKTDTSNSEYFTISDGEINVNF